MALPINTENEDYLFYKTLNEDVQLKPVSKTGNHWDIQMFNGDYVNVTGKDSLFNAIVIAIMTRFQELSDIPLYDEFGCRVHELIKANKSDMVEYEIELFITDVLDQMRRIKEINEIRISDNDDEHYKVYLNVTGINDEIANGSVSL